jgi:predicted ester cyclase
VSTKDNLTAVRRFWEGFNTHNLEIWDEVCTPDFINHDPGLPAPDADLPTIKRTIAELLFTAFPNIMSSEEDTVVEGNKVLVRRTLRGTHTGPFMGIAPTDREIVFGGVWLAHLSGGKIREQWVYFDALGTLQQVGALPAPAQQ